MSRDRFCEQLINDLLADPADFEARGRGNQLLRCCHPIFLKETLVPLLSHNNVFVRRTAIFVVSELGDRASGIIRDVVPLIHDDDPNIQWDALESVMVCYTGPN